jgi:hypothetical protein
MLSLQNSHARGRLLFVKGWRGWLVVVSWRRSRVHLIHLILLIDHLISAILFIPRRTSDMRHSRATLLSVRRLLSPGSSCWLPIRYCAERRHSATCACEDAISTKGKYEFNLDVLADLLIATGQLLDDEKSLAHLKRSCLMG